METKSINPFEGKKIKSIDIVFENCETYNVPAEGIHRLSLGNLSYSLTLHINGLRKWENPGELTDWCSTDYVSLILNKKGMEIKSSWEEMFNCELLKDRIKSGDITNLDLNFTDGTNLYVGVPWEDDYSEFINKYQHTDIKDEYAYIDIAKNIDEDEFQKENNYLYEYETSKSNEDYKFDFSEDIKNNNYEDIEILTLDEENEEFGYEVPNYVQAAFRQIDEELCRVMWNINQEEFPSPFDNTSNEFKNNVFEVEAYSWDDEYNQEYNFKWRDYKVRWYKHSRRDPEANRNITPEECAKMLDECLNSIIKMDIDEDDIFPNENHKCVQCGEDTCYKELQNGEWACEECLNNLGREQLNLKEEVENSLFEFGFDNYEDITSCIDTFLDIFKYAQKNTTIETLEHLIKGLEAININIKFENDLLEGEIAKKIEETLKNW